MKITIKKADEPTKKYKKSGEAKKGEIWNPTILNLTV